MAWDLRVHRNDTLKERAFEKRIAHKGEHTCETCCVNICSLWEMDCQPFPLAKGSAALVPLGKGTAKTEGTNTLSCLCLLLKAAAKPCTAMRKKCLLQGEAASVGNSSVSWPVPCIFFTWKYWFSLWFFYCFFTWKYWFFTLIFLLIFFWKYWFSLWFFYWFFLLFFFDFIEKTLGFFYWIFFQ